MISGGLRRSITFPSFSRSDEWREGRHQFAERPAARVEWGGKPVICISVDERICWRAVGLAHLLWRGHGYECATLRTSRDGRCTGCIACQCGRRCIAAAFGGVKADSISRDHTSLPADPESWPARRVSGKRLRIMRLGESVNTICPGQKRESMPEVKVWTKRKLRGVS